MDFELNREELQRGLWAGFGQSRFLRWSRKKILPGARFSKVPIINGPGKPSPFILKIEVSNVLHLA